MGGLHTSRRGDRPQSRVTPLHLLAAAAILGLLVMPVAFAGVGEPGATKSANLTKQIKKLKRRVAALEAKAVVPGPQGPQGPQGPAGTLGGAAGGDLAGSYPDPVIASSAVNSAKVANNTLTGDDIAESTLGQVPSALTAPLGGLGRSAVGAFCDPESVAVVVCGATEFINLPAPARALVVAGVDADTEIGSDQGFGQCFIGTSVTGPIAGTGVQIEAVDPNGLETGGEAALTTVTEPLGPGVVSYGLNCNQGGVGAIEYDNIQVSAVVLSGN
jgi:hypothetical protein